MFFHCSLLCSGQFQPTPHSSSSLYWIKVASVRLLHSKVILLSFVNKKHSFVGRGFDTVNILLLKLSTRLLFISTWDSCFLFYSMSLLLLMSNLPRFDYQKPLRAGFCVLLPKPHHSEHFSLLSGTTGPFCTFLALAL